MSDLSLTQFIQVETDRLYGCRINAHSSNDKILNTVIYILSAETVIGGLVPNPDDNEAQQNSIRIQLTSALREWGSKFQAAPSMATSVPIVLCPTNVIAAWAGMKASFIEQDGADIAEPKFGKKPSETQAALALKNWIPHAIHYNHNLALGDAKLKVLPEREIRFAATVIATWDAIAIVAAEYGHLDRGILLHTLRAMPDETLTYYEKTALGLTATEDLFFCYPSETPVPLIMPDRRETRSSSSYPIL
jgi:hypothetical protein